MGEEAKHRRHTGKHWNKKFIRAIQSILNVTKGIVAPSHKGEKSSFFREAFGKDLTEFFEILYMPETYIIYRHLFRFDLNYTQVWENEYRSLSDIDRKTAQAIIESNDFTENNIEQNTPSPQVKHFLRHYTVSRDDIVQSDGEYQKLKTKFDKLIKEDQFINLTLTYDFEEDTAIKSTVGLFG